MQLASNQRYFGLRGGWLVFWITVACATDMTLFGYDQGVFSGVVVSDNFLQLHDLVGPSKTKILSTVAAIYNVGCFIGAIVAFTVGERLGRKKSILLGTAIMTIGVILKTSSFSLAQMFVGRVILGIGNGINTATAPIWQTETAPARLRGKLVILEMMTNVGGFMLVNWINYGLSFVPGSIQWRLPLALQFIFIIVLFATVPWLPESPRWLIAHDRTEEAIQILADLENKSVDHAYIIAQHQEIVYGVQYERQHSIKWSDLFRGRTEDGTKSVRRLLLGAGTQLMQQFGGINISSYYAPTIYITYVGLSNSMARLLSACNAVSYFIFAGFALLAFLGISILLKFAIANGSTACAEASIFFFFFYNIAFAVGMLGVPWLYPTEINSLPMRTKGAAVATATNWITNFVIVEITPIGFQNLGWKFWPIWVVTNALFLPIIYLAYPETSSRTLEDLDTYFRSNPGLIVINDKDAISSKRPLKYIERENEEVQKVEQQNTRARKRGRLHILHYNGVLDAYGHISVRNPNDGSNFFMSRNLAPALVANSSDLVEYRVEDAAPIDPNAPGGFLERYIHSELYKRFPSINSVVHSHSPQVVPYTFSGVPLRSCIHMAGFLGDETPNFDITVHYEPGDNQDILIRSQRLGAALAAEFSSDRSLPNATQTEADHAVVLMQNHGFTTVASSIKLAVMQAVYTQVNAGIQTTALTIQNSNPNRNQQGLSFLSSQQAVKTWTTMSGTSDRPWGLWSHEVRSSNLYQNLLDPNQTQPAAPLL
ncbi:general substrate transporter [Aureobasidium subglaciale]|nr:general substrate transporter [Aureobasidium subglaciale]